MPLGNQKGASFERKVCVQLSLWITNGAREDCLWRSAMSGGRATVRNRAAVPIYSQHTGKRVGTRFRFVNNVRQAGDICSVSPEGHVLTDHYFIECKHRRDIRFGNFVLGNYGPLAEWWKIACREAAEYKREPVLIAKSNRVPTVIITYLRSPLNPTPVALVRNCAIGLFDEVLKTPCRLRKVAAE